MFDHQPLQDTTSPKHKTINVMQNGCPDNIFKLNFIKPVTRLDIAQAAQKNWWPTRYKSIRLYGVDAVELFDEDLLYLKNGEKVFVSRGEDFDSNKNFGEYEVVRALGEGGFGNVSLGLNKLTGEYVAIKVVKANKANSSTCIDMIFRQAQNLKSLSHPNIVKIINCYTLKNMKFVVVMEYVEGGELRELLKEKGKFEEEEARIYFKQIVSAVAYCHRQSIVHRDLKVQNILLTKDKQIKVADFGISGVADRFNAEVDWGTLKYMSPEILSKKEKVNAFAGDVWACGIILFYMVEGYLPYNGNSSPQIISKIIHSPVQFPPDSQTSQSCRDLICRMLDKNPKQRYTLDQVQSSMWYIRGRQTISLKTTPSMTLNHVEAVKNCFKPRKIVKKTTVAIPKRLEKQKNQLLEELQGYKMTRKLYKSESKALPQLRTSLNRNIKNAQAYKLSSIDLESTKKSFFRPS